jgi:hypothetical protein
MACAVSDRLAGYQFDLLANQAAMSALRQATGCELGFHAGAVRGVLGSRR